MNNVRRDVSSTQEQVLDLSLLAAGEKEQLLKVWNNTKTNYPQDQCIHQLFEEQVKRTPDKIAVSFENKQLTYQELNKRANKVARYLQKAKVLPEILVGICLERSLDLIVGLLGILKAGGAYVPLDPAYPYDRLAFMLQDLQLPVVLTEIGCLERLPKHDAHIILIDAEESAIALLSDENLESAVTSVNLAYTIYNSGTGKPKGVQISHQAVVNFLSSMRCEPGMNEQDVMLAVTTMSFNIASLEIYLPLIVGAEIALVSREVAANPIELAQSLADVTVMQAVPSMWRSLLASGWKGNKQLKVFCGGEALNKGLAHQLLEKVGSVWNMYGAAEVTSWCTICQIELGETPISIGRPIANTQIYLLDPVLRRKSDPITPVPVGVMGEMWIGGASLARGYFNRAQMSNNFVPNPFSDEPNSYLYKTRDLARYLPDGNIEFIGRMDNQVKIRGFRIEVEDIEATLGQHPAIKETVVVARENVADGDKYLAAYLVLDSQFFQQSQNKIGEQPIRHSSNILTLPAYSPMTVQPWHNPEEQQAVNKLIEQLQALLREELPEYAIPSVFVVLEALPVTSNGKIDRRALPEPNQFNSTLSEEFVAPNAPSDVK